MASLDIVPTVPAPDIDFYHNGSVDGVDAAAVATAAVVVAAAAAGPADPGLDPGPDSGAERSVPYPDEESVAYFADGITAAADQIAGMRAFL